MVKLVCKWCGKSFEVIKARENTAKYCSDECRLAEKTKDSIIKECEFCGKKFTKQKNEKNKRFCSQECFSKSRKTVSYCKVCGSEIVHSITIERKYCSRECSDADKKRNKQNKCKNCGREYVMKYNTPNQKFCCRECYWEFRNNNPDIKFQTNQGKNLIEKICKTCGKTYYVFPYRKKSADYCSVECFRKNSYNVSKFSLDVFEILRQKFDDIKSEEALKFDDWKLFPDILINNNFIVECQGDYWHSNPNMYNEDFFNKSNGKYAAEIWERDDIRKKYLQERGYMVYFLWEQNWNEDKNSEIEKIIKKESKWNSKK